VLEVFDKPVIQRCQLHKICNVRDKLPQRLRPGVERRMRAAYHAESALAAEAQLTALARELDKTHPGAAASLREGMAETLTVLRLDVPPTLARTLCSRPASSSAASTATCTWQRCAPRSNASSPKLSDPPCKMTSSTWPNDQRAATEVPRNSGQPPLAPVS
jgi:transposase-like protein